MARPQGDEYFSNCVPEAMAELGDAHADLCAADTGVPFRHGGEDA
ncbi:MULTISPECIES: hypothetical protein [unclassified Mesorhizobium]|nr:MULTISPECIES: hypothetical protein [unclassified Mesorhizobium]